MNQSVSPSSDFVKSERFEKLHTFSSINLLVREVNPSEYLTLNNEFDLFIVGNDQLWNVTLLKDLSFMDYSDNCKNISYGGSIGDNSHTKFYLSFIVKRLRTSHFFLSGSLQQFNN